MNDTEYYKLVRPYEDAMNMLLIRVRVVGHSLYNKEEEQLYHTIQSRIKGKDSIENKLEKKKLAEAVPALEKVSRLITGRETVFACKEGSLPFIKTRIINPLFVRYQMSPKPFHATSECIGCKRCEKSCPVGNITMKERRPVWGKNCTACLACYHVCPEHAVQYGKKTKGKGHYFNPDSAY